MNNTQLQVELRQKKWLRLVWRAEEVFKEMKALEAEMEEKIKNEQTPPSSSSEPSSSTVSHLQPHLHFVYISINLRQVQMKRLHLVHRILKT